TPSQAGMPHEDAPAAQVVPARRRYRHDRPRRLRYPVGHFPVPNSAPLSRMNGTGSVAPAELRSPLRCTSKCRCGPDELPVVPTTPMTCPGATIWPTVTSGMRSWWQYLVMMLSACLISRYHPQPRIDGDPSWSHPHHAPD